MSNFRKLSAEVPRYLTAVGVFRYFTRAFQPLQMCEQQFLKRKGTFNSFNCFNIDKT